MSITDPPAPVDQPAHALDEVIVIRQPAGPGPGHPAPTDRSGWPRPVAAVLFAAAGLLNLLFLFISANGVRAYTSAQFDATDGLSGAVLFTVAGLLVLRRTREISVGLARGLAATMASMTLAIFWPPNWGTTDNATVDRLAIGGYFACFAGGAVACAIRRPPGAQADPYGRADTRLQQWTATRAAIVLVGAIGGVGWFIGECMNWIRDVYTPLSSLGEPDGPARIVPCCTFSDMDPWTRASLLTSCVVLVLLAVVAVSVRSRPLGAGLLIGAPFALPQGMIEAVFESIHPSSAPGYSAAGSLLPGWWISLAGLALLLAAGIWQLCRRPAAFAGAPWPVAWAPPWPTPSSPMPGPVLAPVTATAPASACAPGIATTTTLAPEPAPTAEDAPPNPPSPTGTDSPDPL